MNPQILKEMTVVSMQGKFFLEDYEELGLAYEDVILIREKLRLDVKHPRITLKDLGLGKIQKANNLFHLIEQKQIQVLDFKSNSLRQVKFTIKAMKSITFCLEAGTLIFPNDEQACTTQTLIVRNGMERAVLAGESLFQIQTFCFNYELRAPNKEKYLLGNIKSIKYNTGMNQDDVWGITRKMRIQVRQREEEYEKEDSICSTEAEKHDF